MIALLYILKIYLKFIYFFIKLFTKQEEQVFFLSRQYNYVSLNYKEIILELQKQYPKMKIEVVCQKLNNEINDSVRDKNTSSYLKVFSKLESGWNYFISIHKQMKLIACSKVVVVDGYNIPVSLLKHKKETTVIQIWHALAAIKKFGYQSIGYKDGVNKKVAKVLKMHANYDYIISGSYEMKKSFSEAFNTDVNKILAIGTPYVDYLLKSGKRQSQKIYKKYPILKRKKTILYSPTFRKDGRDNINEVINSINLDRYNLIVTCHDKDGKKKVTSPKVLTCNDIPYKDLIKIADYVITDYSALSVEASIVNAKVLLYLYDYDRYKEENGINVDLFEEFGKCASKNIEDLVKIIEEDSYDLEILKKFRNKYNSNLKGNSTKLIAKLIGESMYNKENFDAKTLEPKESREKVLVKQ